MKFKAVSEDIKHARQNRVLTKSNVSKVYFDYSEEDKIK